MKQPELRFKEFTGDWEEVELGEIAELTSGSNKANSEKGRYINLTMGSVSEEGNLLVAKKTNEEGHLLAKGDIVMPTRDIGVGLIIGKTAVIPEDYTYVAGNCLYAIRFKEDDSGFMSKQINNGKCKIDIATKVVGSAQLMIKIEDITEQALYRPELEEQQKIALLFSTLDQKIDLQTKKLEQSTQLKQGLMQQIFSQELRFNSDSGEEYPDWEEKKVSEIFDLTRGTVIPKKDLREDRDETYNVPVYSSQTSNNGILGWDRTGDFEGEYITWTTDGAYAGKVFAREGKFRCTNVCGVMVEKVEYRGYANKLTSEIIERAAVSSVGRSGNPKLMNNVMCDVEIVLPSLEEQQKIAGLFNIIDQKIEQEKLKLEQTKQLKQGLMQKMFI